MDILYIANVRMPTEKAHGFQIAKTIEALLENNANVEMLLPKRPNHIEDSIVDYYSLRMPIKIKYIPIPFNFILKVSSSLYFKLERFYFTLLAFIIALFSNRTVYSREITICFLLAIFNKDVVYEDHEPKNSKVWLYRFFLKKIDKKVIVAKNLMELYKEFGIDERAYRFIPNGVDVESFENVKPDKSIWRDRMNISSDKKTVLYIGHFYRWKGIYTLIDASSHIQNAQVVLIGGTDTDYNEVSDYVKRCDINNISLHKFVPHNEIIKFIKSADILVLPNTAKEERSLKYTTPIKLFEYMASGVPIVASKIMSFQNYLEENVNAIMFEPDNAKDLTDKVNNLLNSPGLIERISQNAHKQVIDYSWDKRAEKIIEFIKE